MRLFILLFLLVCNLAWAGFTDLQFGRYQIADSQWNVSACMYTATCEIYSTNPGTMYKIPWYTGQWNWQSGQYVKFANTGDATNPYEGKVYNSDGSLAGTLGTGHIINMGVDGNGFALFFFVGNDNDTGQLFSSNHGFTGNGGYSWTGTLNPTTAQVDSFANSYGSTTPLSSGQSYTPAPSLCCGGSASAFTADSLHIIKIQAFTQRTSADSQVYIEQIGNSSTITIDQSGSRNNYARVVASGSSNDISVTQSGQSNAAVNYTDLAINGNNNTVGINQMGSGTKGAFATVNDSYNTLSIIQKDSGSHYASVVLNGGNKNVDITQQGNAGHMANVTLSGLPVDLSLSQSGGTQQFYSINFNCATQGGCPKITVQQGQ